MKLELSLTKARPSKDNLDEAKRIAARMLAMPPEPHRPIGKPVKTKDAQAKPKRTTATRKGR